MYGFRYDVVVPEEAEVVFEYTITAGESLLLYGVEDFSQILSWLNVADLSLELVPSCRDSFRSCFDWDGTNRERVEIALSILRDARKKIHNPLYAALLHPSRDYWILMERVSGRSVGPRLHNPAPT